MSSEAKWGNSAFRKMTSLLANAVDAGHFALHYQPIVRLADGSVQHHEVLLRLPGPDGNLIYPAEFLPVAETKGMMPGVTAWVIDRAIEVLRANPDLRLFVNLGAQSIGNHELYDFLSQRLRGIDPTRLGFEISENTLISNISDVVNWMQRIKGLGCRFAIDDFGAGHTATVILVNLPVDFVKVDGSLTTGIVDDPDKRSLVEAVNAMATGQKKAVIAEFVEDGAIADKLRELGIEFGQGYFFGRPEPTF